MEGDAYPCPMINVRLTMNKIITASSSGNHASPSLLYWYLVTVCHHTVTTLMYIFHAFYRKLLLFLWKVTAGLQGVTRAFFFLIFFFLFSFFSIIHLLIITLLCHLFKIFFILAICNGKSKIRNISIYEISRKLLFYFVTKNDKPKDLIILFHFVIFFLSSV